MIELPNIQTYAVGGSVRDELMGRPSSDSDWVVVGSTPDEMTSLGFDQVGAAFPVFLHPETRDEYALARRERKVSPGYTGFEFDTSTNVTLEEDLGRRDLTVNAIAKDSQGNYIDPFGGIDDIKSKVFRHVSSAFGEDPVRILRVARFSSRHPDFTIAPETLKLMKDMVLSGEVDALVPERVCQEIWKGMSEKQPKRMFEVLQSIGALEKVFTYVSRSDLEICDKVVDDDRRPWHIFAILLHSRDPTEIDSICDKLRMPSYVAARARLVALTHKSILSVKSNSSGKILAVLELTRALNDPRQFYEVITTSEYIGGVQIRSEWEKIVNAVASIDCEAIVKSCSNKADIPNAIREARLNSIHGL